MKMIIHRTPKPWRQLLQQAAEEYVAENGPHSTGELGSMSNPFLHEAESAHDRVEVIAVQS